MIAQMQKVRLAAAAALIAAAAVPAGAQVIAIEGGTVHPMTGSPLERGTVLVRDGRIVAVGTRIEVPAGAIRIDARGMHVTPGLIDSWTQIGAIEVNAVGGSVDVSMTQPGDELRQQVRAAFNIVDGINPASMVIPVTRIAGVTTAVSRPSGGLISGQGIALDLDGRTVADMLIRTPVGMFATLGEGAQRGTGGSRGATMLRLREVLDDARVYARNRAAYERGGTRDLAAGRLDLEALQPVLRGELPLVVEVHRASDILAALRLASDYDLRLILAGVTEGWRVAEDIARAGVPVVTRVLDNLPGSFERLGARYDNAELMRRAGVRVALTSGDTHNARNIRQEAGMAVAHGMPHFEAMRAITAQPAELWGLEDHGTLLPGSVANIVIWDGDPLELLTTVRHVLIRGREMPLTSRQTQLRDRYLDPTRRERAYPPP